MSNINPNNIDGTYPIAGQDNDSQGFRDNFTNLKNNLTFAKTELEDLEAKVVLKSALAGGTLANDFADAPVSGAKIKDFSETRFDFGTTSGTITVNHLNGHYQTVTSSGSLIIAFSNWPPAGALGRIRVEVEVTSVAHTFTIPAAVTIGTDGIPGIDGDTITFRETGKFIFEFTTEDSGTSIAINDLTRGRHIPIGSANVQYLSSIASTTSASLADIGLSFPAIANEVYKFEAFIPFTHSTSTTNTHTFSVNFSAGTCNFVVEQQDAPGSAFAAFASNASDNAGSATTTASTSMRMAKVTGTYTNASNTVVNIRYATSGGTLSAQIGGNLTWTRVG